MDNFLAAVDNRQGVTVTLGGLERFVSRCRLLGHLQLSEIEIKIREAHEAQALASLIRQYLCRAGVQAEDLDRATGTESLLAFYALRHLNTWQWLLPWLSKPDTNPTGPPEVYHYDGRRWAIWVHKLASRYGWTPEVIWNLYPEEAAAYMQEIFVSEFQEREDRRALSEVSYSYDKATQQSRFIPTPRYSWMIDEAPPEKVRIPIKALPVGNVVKIEQ